jgi:two-component system osmolarity sensor histidine kinase EnvZ
MTDTLPPSQSVPRRVPFKLRFKHILPRSLFGRTLLIIVVPTLLTLGVATFVFFDRHWYTVTNRLTMGVAGDIATVVELMQGSGTPGSMVAIERLADTKMNLIVSFAPGKTLDDHPVKNYSPVRELLHRSLNDKLSYPFDLDIRHAQEVIVVHVGVPEGLYTILVPERRVFTPTTQVFIAWMVGSSIFLSVVALLFMRNQIRPVRRLAEAAEAIGKGRDVPWFKLEGAAEVRQAAAALMVMRDRLKRQITQRTAMLAGVSHDLRTPLTRMRLQLELMPETDESRELSGDVDEMEAMLNAYLAFARGEEAEPESAVDLAELLNEIVASARRQNSALNVNAPVGAEVMMRRQAMRRCLMNLVSNALRYGKRAEINVVLRDHAVDIVIDDDGPGIAADKREDMFRPFTRLEESRNPATGGIGLGLTIARDIARFHGGDVILEDSPLGGLRARVWLPI